jgi:hypothetical protein
VWREEVGSEWTGWREFHFGFAPARRRWLFNPELILNKAVSDLVGSLLPVGRAMEERTVLLNAAYLAVLSVVMKQPAVTGSSSVQFAVVRTSVDGATRRLDVVFLSEIHGTTEIPAHVFKS